MLILNGLGHPGYLDRESARRLQEISENERKETQSITVSVPDGKGQ
jgi:hypothetical protein